MIDSKQRLGNPPLFPKILAEAGKLGSRGETAVSAVADICRLYSLDLSYHKDSHVGACLGLADLVSTLYCRRLISWRDTAGLTDPALSDTLFLSIGHSASLFYSLYHILGAVRANQLLTARTMHGLPHHPETRLTPHLFFLSSGSLGQGLSEAIGAAKALRHTHPKRRVFVLVGDGEAQEGNVQEAIAYAGTATDLDNLVAVIDCNGIQLSGSTHKHNFTPDYLQGLFELNHWRVEQIDAHEICKIQSGFESAISVRGRPSVLLAKSVLGKGVSFMEEAAAKGKSTFHHGAGALTKKKYCQARQEISDSLADSLGKLNSGWVDEFDAWSLRPGDFSPPVMKVEQEDGKTTQDAFLDGLCGMIGEGVPIAYTIGDLTESSSVGGARIREAIENKRKEDAHYVGVYADVGIREQLASTMLKGFSRASQQRDGEGKTVAQTYVPVFACYAHIINLILEPMHRAARDDQQLIVNTPQFGSLFQRGGNSHNTSVLCLTNFLPVYLPATEYEAEKLVRTAGRLIQEGEEGACAIATSRVWISPARLGTEHLMDTDTIDAVNTAVKTAWRSNAPWVAGAYAVGKPDEAEEPDATIVTSGPMTYFSYQAKRRMERNGLKVQVINVVCFSRERSELLASELGKLLPRRGPVLTVWDGDRTILYERVCTAAMAAGKGDLEIKPHGPTDESDCSGSVGEVMEANGLRPSDIEEVLSRPFY